MADSDWMATSEPAMDPEARDLAFKMIAAHALVDPEFYTSLRADPRAAAKKLHIKLTDEDVARINSIDWATIDRYAAAVRTAISPAMATSGPLW